LASRRLPAENAYSQHSQNFAVVEYSSSVSLQRSRQTAEAYLKYVADTLLNLNATTAK